MNQHLKETLEKNTMTLEGGEFIDAYNRVIKKDIAGCIYAGVDQKNQIFVVVKDDSDRRNTGTSEYKG